MGDEEQKDEIAEKQLEDVCIIKPLDGGYGWLVVAASFFANLIVDGIIFTAGASLLKLWQVGFVTTDAAVSLTMSILSGSYLLIGPICAVLANLYGCRAVVIGGSILSFFGFLCSSIAPQIVFLYITFGLIGGVGLGLVYLPAIVVISQYFEKKRALATGLAVCGSGIGTTLFSTINPYVMELFDDNWRLFVVFLAVLPLTCIFAAIIFRPVVASSNQIEKVAQIAESVQERKHSLSPEANGPLKSFNNQRPFLSTLELNAQKHEKSGIGMSQHDIADAAARESVRDLNRPLSKADVFYPGSTTSLRHRERSRTISGGSRHESVPPAGQGQGVRDSTVFLSTIGLQTVGVDEAPATITGQKGWRQELCGSLKSLLDPTLLYSPSFLILAFSGFLTMICFYVPFNYLGTQMDKLGELTNEEKTRPIAILGILNIIARIVCGWLSDLPQADVLLISNICIMLAGAATFAIPLFTQYWMYIAFCVPFACGVACFAALRSVICVELFGMEKLSNAFGILLMCMGFGALSGTPIAATIKDVTGNFDVSFYIMGILMMISGAICFPLRRLRQWEDRRASKADAQNDGELQPLK